MKTTWLNSFLHARVAAALPAVLGILAASAPAQTIPNGSFEADAFAVAPGHISENASITGWTVTHPNYIGLNPAGGTNVFANNGAVPDGAQVAFIRSSSGAVPALSTVVTGLTPGQNYMLQFRMNAAAVSATNTNATVRVALDDVTMLSFMNVPPVGGANPYRYVALPFTATAAQHTLSLINDRLANSVALLDDFTVGVSTTRWSVSPWTDDLTCDVDPSRHYTHAYNFGSTANTAVVNGVTFIGLAGANPGAEEMGTRNFGTAHNADDANTITASGGTSAELAKRFIYNGNPETVVLGGLVPGVEYVATFYSVGYDDPSLGRVATFQAGEDRLTVDQNQFGNNNGIRISHRYVAPPSGIMTLACSPFKLGTTIHIYAFSNYEVTAPALPVVLAARPASQIGAPGSTARFRATHTGAQPLTLQWLKDGAPIADETNATLSVAVADGSSAGGYALVASNPSGSATSTVATLALGTIANPGFEADTFFAFPGYVSANGPISGWATTYANMAGINPLVDGAAPFANNGIVPEGAQVAFLQRTNTLSTTLTGLTPGQTYSLGWRYNARGGYAKPGLHLLIDDVLILDMAVSPNGGAGTTSLYRHASFDFTATVATHTLTISNSTAGDCAALLDDFRIGVSSSRWSYAQWTDDASSGVDPARNYTHAFKFAEDVDFALNGVRFTGLAPGNPAVAGQLATAGFPNRYVNDANVPVLGGGGSALLGRDFVYGAATQTVTVLGLVPGVEYLATIYGVAFDVKAYGRAATFSVGDDRMTINEDHFENDNGIRVMYRYVADYSGSITLNFVPTDSAASFHTFGFSNCELASTNAPSVHQQPRDIQWVSSGSEVTLYAMAGGQTPLSYQWQKDGVNLADQTNATLTLSGVTLAETGGYRLIVSNARGAVTSQVSTLEVGLAVVNPSFESDSFYVYPGYITNNALITGWFNSAFSVGLNPIAYTAAANNPNDRPFANNGTIPDGRQVAFLQEDGTMSQTISGFTVGSAYVVKYFENARLGASLPSLTVTLGGVPVVPLHEVATGAYRAVISEPFVAPADTLDLAFIKSGSQGGDNTVLLDQVAVLPLAAMAPQIMMEPEPASQWAATGETVQFQVSATGSLPLFLQWQRDGLNLDAETNATLFLANLALNQTGTYRMIASNQYGSVTSRACFVQVGLALGGLFNTGVDASGAPAEGATADLHYRLVYSDNPAHPGPDAIVLNDLYPIPPYLASGPSSKWIAPMSNVGGFSDLPGLYVYRTTFLMDITDPAAVHIDARVAVDNLCPVVRLNGTQVNPVVYGGFAAWTEFAITNGFAAGINVLEFVTSNAPPAGPTAFRAELHGVALPLAPGLPWIANQPQHLLAQELQGATFEVGASGSAPLTYQWFYNGAPLPGETNRTLWVAGAKSEEGGYRVAAINPSGSATSDVAMLTVNRPPAPLPDTMAALPDLPFTFPAPRLARNDSDPDGDPVGVAAVSAVSLQGGVAVFTNAVVTYIPPAGFTGEDLFTYTASDGRGGTAMTNVVVRVDPAAFIVQSLSQPVLTADALYRIRFTGMPDCTYMIETATNLLPPSVWSPMTNLTADPGGLVELLDKPLGPAERARFYRAVYP